MQATARMRGVGEAFVDVGVEIRSISCEGAGVALLTPWPVERRQRVTLDFTIDAHRFVMPGSVVWVSRRSFEELEQPGLDFGVRYQLAAVTSHDRQFYAEWIITALRHHGVVSQAPMRR